MLQVFLTGAACNATTNQGNANSGSNTAGQTAGGGTGTAATGGKNTANQGISQSNSATTASQCAAGTLTGSACNRTHKPRQFKFRKQHCWSGSCRRNKINNFFYFY